MTTDSVQYEVIDDVAWVTLNRPDRRNAFDAPMLEELRAAVERGQEAGVIVITGAGKGFCAGGFLAALAQGDLEGHEADVRDLYFTTLRTFESIRRSPRPVIAAVNGAAAGGGNELVVTCDLAIAGDSATFGQTGPRVGSAPVLGGTNLLAISIGEKRAKEVSFLCRRYSAQQALEMGWINAVVPDEELRDEVTRWANELLDLSPRYLQIAKTASNVWWNLCYESYLGGFEALSQTIGSDDMLEGARAFLERRKPEFRRSRT